MQISFENQLKSVREEFDSYKKAPEKENEASSSDLFNCNQTFSTGSPSIISKKRKTLNVNYQVKENSNYNQSNKPIRSKTIIKGDVDDKNIKMAHRVFELYIGGIAEEETEDNIKQFFESKGVTIVELVKINTRIPKSKAFKATISKESVGIIYDNKQKLAKKHDIK